MPKYNLTCKKQHKQSKYVGVYRTTDGWIAKMTVNKKQHIFGPFDNEINAAKMYDTEALKHRKERAYLNILKNPYSVPEPKAKKTKQPTQPKKVDISASEANKRVKFSIVTKNRICSKQRWCCNYCKNLLTDIFIVDHVVPLFLGGTNAEYNLQALCPSCDRFKTSYLDYKVIKPLSEKRSITPNDVYKIQQDNYHKMMCVDPSTSTINNTETMNINCQQYITNSRVITGNTNTGALNISANNGLELIINGVKIHINV